MKTLKIDITDESFDLLKKINDVGYIEFRNNKDNDYLHELIQNNLIEIDFESWHLTYVISNQGEQMINENKYLK